MDDLETRVAAWRIQTKPPVWVRKQLEAERVPLERIQALLAKEYGEEYEQLKDSRRWRRMAGLVLFLLGTGASVGLFWSIPGQNLICGLFLAVGAVGLAIMVFPDALKHLLRAILPE